MFGIADFSRGPRLYTRVRMPFAGVKVRGDLQL
jgi:hypothetical protein